jgi:hypothetical protein
MSTLLYGPGGEPLITRPDPDADFDPSLPQPGVACVGCGCTDDDGCPPNGCYWVGPGMCSECFLDDNQPDLVLP